MERCAQLRLASRYAHAREMKRARREIKRLKTYLSRVFRAVRRKLQARPDLAARFARPLALVERLLAQQRTHKNKLYALHAPEVACIAKGKAHKKYEFGARLSTIKTLAGFDFTFQPSLDRNRVLALAQLASVDRGSAHN